MKDTQNKQFEQQLKATLDKSLDAIDPDVQYRLQIARANVLEKQANVTPWYKRRYTWATITGMVSVCVLGFSLLTSVTSINSLGTDLTSNVDVNMFDEEASIELYEEYDFYVWLSQQESNT